MLRVCSAQLCPHVRVSQVEGFVIGENLSLGNLMGTIADFYKRLGPEFADMKFKPTYNPYTEPSMEFCCYHPTLKKWVEVGNSGVFRPEMLRPMGFPPNISVIAWGMSLERPTMIKYGAPMWPQPHAGGCAGICRQGSRRCGAMRLFTDMFTLDTGGAHEPTPCVPAWWRVAGTSSRIYARSLATGLTST